MSAGGGTSSRRWVHWLVTVVGFVAVYAWMTRGTASPLLGSPAPAVTLSVVAGDEVDAPERVHLPELGRVVVLEFWASWCTACRRTAPLLNELRDELAGADLAFYAVNVEPIDRQRLEAAHAAFGTRFPTLHDRTGEAQRRYAIKMLPTVVVIDREGLVRWASTGVPSKIRLRAAISEALD